MSQRGLVRTPATFTKMQKYKMHYSLNASNIANGTTRFSANASYFYENAKMQNAIFLERQQHCKWHNTVFCEPQQFRQNHQKYTNVPPTALRAGKRTFGGHIYVCVYVYTLTYLKVDPNGDILLAAIYF